MKKPKTILTTVTLLLLFFTGCEPKPQTIHYGSDQCDYCRMMITEPEFASQAVNMQSRAYKFDSVECMAAFERTNSNPEDIHSYWVPNFLNSDEWLEATSAVYLSSETLRSPMGLYLSAYADRESARQMQQEYDGDIISFEQVQEIVEAEWLQNGSNRQSMQN